MTCAHITSALAGCPWSASGQLQSVAKGGNHPIAIAQITPKFTTITPGAAVAFPLEGTGVKHLLLRVFSHDLGAALPSLDRRSVLDRSSGAPHATLL